MGKTVQGLLLLAHGSELPGAEQDLLQLASFLREQGAVEEVQVGFLDYTEPDIASAVDRLAQRGVTELLVMPYFLSAGFLLKKALRQVEAAVAMHPHLQWQALQPVAGHPRLVEVVFDRIRQAEKSAEHTS